MAHHHFFIDNETKWEIAEHLREHIVRFLIILVLYFSFKAIHLCKRLGLVVASGQEEVLRQINFPHTECQNDFD